MLCNITDPTSRCSLGCQPPISKRDVRTRETASGSKSYVMTRGPMNFIDNDKSRDVEQTAGIMNKLFWIGSSYVGKLHVQFHQTCLI